MKEDWKQRLNCMKHIATYFLKIVVGLFFVICIFQQEGYALSFTSGNIKYETNADGTSVSVIENRSSSAMVVRSLYSGDISIPANVTYSGKTYKREFGIRNAIKKLNRQLEKVVGSFGNFVDI